MATTKKQPRRKKADWLGSALLILQAEGIDGVWVERLARDLNVAKSGFYWHFKDRLEVWWVVDWNWWLSSSSAPGVHHGEAIVEL